MNDLTFYKECYYYEIEQKEKINTRITFPVGIVTLLLNGLIYFANRYMDILSQRLKLVFIIGLIIVTISLIITIAYIIRAFFGHTYCYIAKLIDLNNYKKQLENHYNTNKSYYQNSINKETFVEREYDKYLCNKFIEAADNNKQSNLNKMNYLRKSSYFLLATLIVIFFCSIIFAFSINDSTQKTIIEVSNIEEISPSEKYVHIDDEFYRILEKTLDEMVINMDIEEELNELLNQIKQMLEDNTAKSNVIEREVQQ